MMQYLGKLLIVSIAASAQISEGASVALTFKEKIPINRSLFESSGKKTLSLQPLTQAKLALRNEDFKSCYQLAESGFSAQPTIRPWIAALMLECAIGMSAISGHPVVALQKSIGRVDEHTDWLLSGPWATSLKSLYVQAQLALAQNTLRDKRAVALAALNRLLNLKAWMSREQSAEVFKILGEIHFLAQDWQLSQECFLRSLELKDTEEIRARLESFKGLIENKKSERTLPNPQPSPTEPVVASTLESSGEEEEIYQRMKAGFKTGDAISIFEDGMRLIQNFPGGRRAKWAQERIIETFLASAQKSATDNSNVRSRLIRIMLQADGGRLADWAATLFQKGFYTEALALAEKSYSKLQGHPDSTRILRLAGRAALLSGDGAAAKKNFEILAREHTGTLESVEAVFRIGLIHYRKKEWAEAIGAFERVMALPSGDEYQYPALYWYWRVQQKTQPQVANKAAERLIARYPLTYYGLRARAELNDSTLSFPDLGAMPPLQATLLLTEPEHAGFKRMRLLLQLGWLKETQDELKLLPRGRTTLQKFLMARFFSAALDNVTGFQLLNQALDEDHAFFRPEILSIAFPKEFTSSISTETDRLGLPPSLVLGLIRQESSFRVDAVSTAQALGLMQVLAPTAKEVGADLNIKFKSDIQKTMYDPVTNIRIGTTYLSRLMKSFKGYVPLALAAYNVGPGNIRRFLQGRADLINLDTVGSNPDDEVWIDELPWSETSFYVKAVLRNYLVYQWLDSPHLKLPTPVWKFEPSQK